MNDLLDIQNEILSERQRQDTEWGGAEHDDTHTSWDWRDYILEHTEKAMHCWPGSLRARLRIIEVAALGYAVTDCLTRERERGELATALQDAANWGIDTFPDVPAAFVASRVADEGRELADAPADASEAADVLILVAIWAVKSGVDLAEAVQEKLAINRERAWHRDTMKHVKPVQP